MKLHEIDALVAEKVMGWELSWLGTDWREETNANTHHHKRSKGDFLPSTNIQDAWLVVEKLKVEYWIEINVGEKYLCDIGKYGIPGTIVQIEAETASLAICLAALKAVGVEVEE